MNGQQKVVTIRLDESAAADIAALKESTGHATASKALLCAARQFPALRRDSRKLQTLRAALRQVNED